MDTLLLINKPAGLTSHDVVDEVRRIMKTRRVGHAGTLDPFATGLLIIGVGQGTKKLHELQGLPKTYEAVAQLGATSSTGDPESVIIENAKYQMPNIKSIENVLQRFVGEIQQIPPMYSAKKIQGQKLYELARRGITVERKPVAVTVYALDLITYNLKPKTFTFRAIVSSGTYIRTLTEDMGKALGCGAYLTELKRTAIGPYRLKDSKELHDLQFSPSPRGS